LRCQAKSILPKRKTKCFRNPGADCRKDIRGGAGRSDAEFFGGAPKKWAEGGMTGLFRQAPIYPAV